MKNIGIIIKKELKRFFTDKRMLASLILPGFLIFIIYTLIGTLMPKLVDVDENYTYKVYLSDEHPEIFKPVYAGIKIEYLDLLEKTDLEIKEEIKNQEVDAYIIYSGDFSNLGLPGERNIQIYYNSVKKESAMFFNLVSGALNSLEGAIQPNIFDINKGEGFDLATKEEKGGMMLATMLPYLLLVLLFSGCMAVVPESIAGEKERGTIATLLVTPLKRSHLATGKIISLSLVSLVSAISTFIGLSLSLPKLMQMNEAAGITAVGYKALDYVYIIFILISTVLLFVSILSLVSTISKSVKEANSYAAPIMIIVLAVGMMAMFGAKGTNPALYLIPIYNVAMALTSILSFEASALNISITILANLVYAILISLILGKMFNNENIMFSK